MVSVRPVLASIAQNEPRGAKLALKTLGPIWLLGSNWLSSFYSARKKSTAKWKAMKMSHTHVLSNYSCLFVK